MFNRDSLSVEEWAQVIAAPASVGALVVTADPSGPMGLIGEFRAIMKSIKEYVDAHAGDSPLMGALQSHLTTKPSEEEEAQMKEWAQTEKESMKAAKPNTVEEMKQMVRDRTTETFAMLRAKGADEMDINTFKVMLITVAEATAEASKEGGFLGFGGVRVSDAEQTMLAQIRAELG